MSFERPYRIAWMNMKLINIHIAKMHSHHIWGTDVYMATCTLYPLTHGRHRNARSLPTIQDKRELAGWREGVVGGDLVLRWGNFSPVITTLLYQPGRHSDSCGGGVILWYIVQEGLGQNAKHSWWKSDILFKAQVQVTQKPAPAFPKLHNFIVYFPRWLYDLLMCG